MKIFFKNKVATQNCDSEAETAIRDSIQAKLNCTLITNMKCTNRVLWELIDELNTIKTDLLGKLIFRAIANNLNVHL